MKWTMIIINMYFIFLVFIILNFLESKSRILIILARSVDKSFIMSSKVIPIVLYYIKLYRTSIRLNKFLDNIYHPF